MGVWVGAAKVMVGLARGLAESGGWVARTRRAGTGDVCPRGWGRMSRYGVVRGRLGVSQVFIKMRTHVPTVGGHMSLQRFPKNTAPVHSSGLY